MENDIEISGVRFEHSTFGITHIESILRLRWVWLWNLIKGGDVRVAVEWKMISFGTKADFQQTRVTYV
jgi:hypothetical protein